MRNLVSLLCLIVFLGVAMPSKAQLRENVHSQDARAQLYGTQGTSFSLNQLFSPEHFQMSHSYEMSAGSFGGTTSSLGMYTNTMRFQFNDQLAARVDMAYAFSPFGGSNALGAGMDQGRAFLRNAEVAYRPSENVQLHLQIRQSPFGGYMSPYGPMSRYGYGHYYDSGMHGRLGRRSVDDLFWNDNLR